MDYKENEENKICLREPQGINRGTKRSTEGEILEKNKLISVTMSVCPSGANSDDQSVCFPPILTFSA